MRRALRREVFSGELVLGAAVDLAELALRRGAHVRTIDDEGNPIGDTREPGAMLWLEVGDRAIVAAANLDDDSIGCVEVANIRADGRMIVQLVGGGVLPLGDVHVVLVVLDDHGAVALGAAHELGAAVAVVQRGGARGGRVLAQVEELERPAGAAGRSSARSYRPIRAAVASPLITA